MPEAQPGLRERKRLATRRAIQVAVLRLVRDNGYDAVTVDMIGREADVSPRTFFNYFPSKEEAVVGDPPHIPDGPEIDHFVAGGGRDRLLADLVDLVERAMEVLVTDRELVHWRRAVLRDHPELFARRSAGLHEFEAQLLDLLERRFAVDDPSLAADPAALRAVAGLASLVVMATLRHAWTAWIDPAVTPARDDNPEKSLRAQLDASFQALGTLWSRQSPAIG